MTSLTLLCVFLNRSYLNKSYFVGEIYTLSVWFLAGKGFLSIDSARKHRGLLRHCTWWRRSLRATLFSPIIPRRCAEYQTVIWRTFFFKKEQRYERTSLKGNCITVAKVDVVSRESAVCKQCLLCLQTMPSWAGNTHTFARTGAEFEIPTGVRNPWRHKTWRLNLLELVK